MKPNKPLNFFVVIIAAVISSALYKQFDAESLSFEKPALSAVYGLTLILTIYFMVKGNKKKDEK